MQDHDVIILEEPQHSDFHQALGGDITLADYLLELDTDYPTFTLGQYRVLQQLVKAGKKILQIEPYLDQLLWIHSFFADDHRPEELLLGSPAHAVYCTEHEATKNLIQYYRDVRGDDFAKILATMNSFAKVDARRFILRDSLRAKRILEVLVSGQDIYIEAGSIHLLLKSLIAKGLAKEWHLRGEDLDGEIIKMLHLQGSILSPGDELTLDYIFGRPVSRKKWQLDCARALIYSKIIPTDEIADAAGEFPHTRSESAAIAAVKRLSLDECRALFLSIRSISSLEAAEATARYLRLKKG